MADCVSHTIRRPGGEPRHRRGITLVELMVTIAIVVGLMGAGAYSMGFVAQSGLKNEAMRLTSAMNYTWSRAAMNNAQYRMIFNLQNSTYRTEVTSAPVVEKERSGNSEEYLSEEAREAQEEQEEQREREMGATDDSDPFKVNRKPTYKEVEDSELKQHEMRSGVRIQEVIPCDREEPVREGKAAVHFFPNGFQQPAIIVLTNASGDFYSLKTEPLTGRVRVFSKKLEKTEDCGKPEEVQQEW